MIGAAPTSPRTGVPGWLTNAEEDLLAELAAQLSPNDVFVGIGVEYGRSMSVIAHSSASRYIYGVELKPLPAYDANMKEAGLAGRTAILVGDSADVGEQWEGDEIAMLFIDGAHEYPAVLADLENWTPFVKLGGMVVLHDVACETNKLPHPLHYEVKRALDAWRSQNLGDWMWMKSVDSTVVLERVGKEAAELGKDDDTTLSKQSTPAELTPTTDMVDVDEEAVSGMVDKALAWVEDGKFDNESRQAFVKKALQEDDNPTYDEMTQYEPKEKPKRRTRKSKK